MLSSPASMTLDVTPKTEEPEQKAGPFLDINNGSHPPGLPPVSLNHNSFANSYPGSYLNSYGPMESSYSAAAAAQAAYPFTMNNSVSYPYGPSYSPPRMGYPPDPYQTTSLMSSKIDR